MASAAMGAGGEMIGNAFLNGILSSFSARSQEKDKAAAIFLLLEPREILSSPISDEIGSRCIQSAFEISAMLETMIYSGLKRRGRLAKYLGALNGAFRKFPKDLEKLTAAGARNPLERALGMLRLDVGTTLQLMSSTYKLPLPKVLEDPKI